MEWDEYRDRLPDCRPHRRFLVPRHQLPHLNDSKRDDGISVEYRHAGLHHLCKCRGHAPPHTVAAAPSSIAIDADALVSHGTNSPCLEPPARVLPPSLLTPPLSIPIETPDKRRGGCSKMADPIPSPSRFETPAKYQRERRECSRIAFSPTPKPTPTPTLVVVHQHKDTPSPSILRHLPQGRGGAAEWQSRRRRSSVPQGLLQHDQWWLAIGHIVQPTPRCPAKVSTPHS